MHFGILTKITTNGTAAGFISATLHLSPSTTVPIVVSSREDASTENILSGQINNNRIMDVENAGSGNVAANSYPGADGYQLDLTGTYTVAQ